MSAQDNLKIDEEIIAAWNAHDVDRSVALLSDDVVWHDIGTPEPFKGKDAARQYIQAWFSAFPDMKITVKNRVVTDDQIASELEFSGTNGGPLQLSPKAPAIPVTGKKVNGKGTYFIRIRNGKVTEVHTYPDAAGMMQQLGLMPGS